MFELGVGSFDIKTFIVIIYGKYRLTTCSTIFTPTNILLPSNRATSSDYYNTICRSTHICKTYICTFFGLSTKSLLYQFTRTTIITLINSQI